MFLFFSEVKEDRESKKMMYLLGLFLVMSKVNSIANAYMLKIEAFVMKTFLNYIIIENGIGDRVYVDLSEDSRDTKSTAFDDCHFLTYVTINIGDREYVDLSEDNRQRINST